ncbi:MAG TPA: hypothetical protein VNO84_08610 [Burkholderiaceae bacterium]|nr:hypothetical protein [Burkholderiaceae bacterium]
MNAPAAPPADALPPALAAALEEVRSLVEDRAWAWPSPQTLAEAQRLLALVERGWPPPALQAEPDGALTFTWEAGERGWLSLQVSGRGTLTHSAVIEGDEYGQEEPFTEDLPPWAHELLRRLWGMLQ